MLIPFLYVISSLSQTQRPIRVHSDQNTRWQLLFPFSTDKEQEFIVLFTHTIPDPGGWSLQRLTRVTASTKLLLCVTCLNPNDSFSAFNKENLIVFAHFYPNEFFIVDLMVLSDQLDMYIIVLRNDDEFFDIEGIISLAEKMIKKKNKDSLERVF